MELQRLTGLSKRQQISAAGRAMFLWVAVSAIVLSFAVVALQFFYQQWAFNNQVLTAKYTASDTLTKNLNNISSLKDNVNQLVGNSDLAASRNADDETNFQVVLDALPTSSDPTALATSIQKVIAPRSGVTLDSVSAPTDTSITTTDTTTQVNAPAELRYSVVVIGNYQSIQTFLLNLEKTIRPMNVTGLSVIGSDVSLRATIDFTTYYQPTASVNVTKKALE